MKTTLYKRSKTGKILEWTIDHDDTSYWTISGQQGGKMTTTAPTVCEQKNIGRANETSVKEQVVLEVAAKVKYNLEHGYYTEIPPEEKPFAVSLAAKYIDRYEANKAEFPYVVQPKLDGIRCYIKMDKDGVIRMRSRANKEFFSCPHILSDPIVIGLLGQFPDLILDGELYNHELKQDFNKIVSLVRKTKPSDKDLEESRDLIYFACFDCFFQNNPELLYVDRNVKLMQAASQCNSDNVKRAIKFVSTSGIDSSDKGEITFVNTNDEVEKYIQQYIDLGYEGVMLKRNVPYFFGRTTDLLKYKRFKDAEYTIIDVEDGKGNKAGIGVSVVCESNGTTFKAGINGTEEFARDMFVNKKNFIGKVCTIKYQELTPEKADGTGAVPRFGKMISIRDYE